MITTKTLTLTNGTAKVAYEFFNAMLQRDGANPEFSYLCYQNAVTLAEPYNGIISQLYNENTDEEFVKFRNEYSKLAMKYADRDPSTGKELYNKDGSLKITENIVEFNEASKKLAEENKEAISNHDTKVNASMEFLAKNAANYELVTIPVSAFPNWTLPVIVGVFGNAE